MIFNTFFLFQIKKKSGKLGFLQKYLGSLSHPLHTFRFSLFTIHRKKFLSYESYILHNTELLHEMPQFVFFNTVRRVLQQSIRVYRIPINRTITYKTVSRKPNEYEQLHYRSPTKNNLIMEYNVYLAMDLSTVFITFTTKGLSPFWFRTVRYRILDREGAKMTMEMIFLSNISKSTYMYLKSIKNIYYLQKQSIKYTKSSSFDKWSWCLQHINVVVR